LLGYERISPPGKSAPDDSRWATRRKAAGAVHTDFERDLSRRKPWVGRSC
jgi:hypothetical protein